MAELNSIRFPNESDQYRRSRNDLLRTEAELRKQIEVVAAMRRTLPQGGKIKEDYIFEEGARDLSDEKTVRNVAVTELFESGKSALVVYSFMYGSQAKNPCPMCTSLLDALNGSAPHLQQRLNFVVAARSPIGRIRECARQRGWNHLRLLSSEKNNYNRDYFAEDEKGNQWPILNVFRQKEEGDIYHFYATELLYAPPEPGQDPRHVDSIWPLWNVLDLIPEGRGASWYPALSYAET